jgi:hypothetical protein
MTPGRTGDRNIPGRLSDGHRPAAGLRQPMTADIVTAFAIYVGTMTVITGVFYYLWMWGE